MRERKHAHARLARTRADVPAHVCWACERAYAVADGDERAHMLTDSAAVNSERVTEGARGMRAEAGGRASVRCRAQPSQLLRMEDVHQPRRSACAAAASAHDDDDALLLSRTLGMHVLVHAHRFSAARVRWRLVLA